MDTEHVFRILPEEAGIRADRYLAEHLPGYSRSYLQSLMEKQRLTIDGKPAKAGRKLRAGEMMGISVPEPEEPEVLPEEIPLSILYEDDALLVVDKPKGMAVHPAPGHPDGTLVNALLAHCRGSLSGINGVLRPGIVHRIDKDTTGALIVCKTDEAHRRGAFHNQEISWHRDRSSGRNGRHRDRKYRPGSEGPEEDGRRQRRRKAGRDPLPGTGSVPRICPVRI